MKIFDISYLDKKRDFSLDSLRALACLMVIGVHVYQRFSFSGALGRFMDKGSTGVSFFFILSGYLAYVSLERLFTADSNIFNVFRKFWLTKIIRVLPLYYMVIFYYFVLYTYKQSVPIDNSGCYWLRYILLLNLWIPEDADFWINIGAVWSISVFVLFYLIAPFLYLIIKKYYVAWIGVVLTYGIYKVTDTVGTGRIPIRYMFYFLIGIVIYLAQKENKLFEMGTILSFVILFCFLADGGTAIISPFLAGLYIVFSRMTQTTISYDSIIYKVVRFVSNISFSLYLVHVAVLLTLDELRIDRNGVYFVLFVIFTISISVFTYLFVEIKLSNKLKRLLKLY